MKPWLQIANKTRRIKALTACMNVSVCVFALLSSSFAFAQVESQTTSGLLDVDAPVAARKDMSLIANETLPTDLLPEELAMPKPQNLNPTKGLRKRSQGRNGWDLDTLTHSTGFGAVGLSAASSRNASSVQPPHTEVTNAVEGTRAVDMITAEQLLSMGDFSSFTDLGRLLPASREDGVINLNTPLRGALFNSPTYDNTNISAFNLGLDGRLCLGTADECHARDAYQIGVGYAKNITHGKQDGFNIQLSPRAGLRFDENSKSALIGALVRIGDNLREGSEMKSNAWYLFAGAEAETVRFDPNSTSRYLTRGDFHLQNRVFINDAQAGFGYRFGTADLALTYFKRQATAENYKFDEDAAALSITWKR
ncbi:MAG: hypothetical protein COA43_06300 [Robiginitomaculum sp.]|nr:MAG: hypothetical protein COA43_06300 [Robiginitomaculum sp.]